MIKEAFQYIVGLGESKTRIEVVNERAYVIVPGGDTRQLPSPLAMPESLEFAFMAGLVGYLRENRDDNLLERLTVSVDNPMDIYLYGPLTLDFAQRATFATVNAKQYLPDSFHYGRYLDIETFVTEAQTHFVDGHDRDEMLQVVGNIRGEAVATVSDDGVSQQVAVSAGIVKVSNTKVPNPVTLAPYRTFCEIDQPASPFVLRLRSGGDGDLPTAALFESGGGEWKREAVSDAAHYLRELLENADVKVPVLA